MYGFFKRHVLLPLYSLAEEVENLLPGRRRASSPPMEEKKKGPSKLVKMVCFMIMFLLSGFLHEIVMVVRIEKEGRLEILCVLVPPSFPVCVCAPPYHTNLCLRLSFHDFTPCRCLLTPPRPTAATSISGGPGPFMASQVRSLLSC